MLKDPRSVPKEKRNRGQRNQIECGARLCPETTVVAKQIKLEKVSGLRPAKEPSRGRGNPIAMYSGKKKKAER